MSTSKSEGDKDVSDAAAQAEAAEVDALLKQDIKPEPRTTVPGDDRRDLDVALGGGSGGALAWLSRRAPSIELFLLVAEKTRQGATKTARAIDLREQHPRFYGACIAVDWIIRVLVILALVLIAAGVAWKTIAPLPRFYR